MKKYYKIYSITLLLVLLITGTLATTRIASAEGYLIKVGILDYRGVKNTQQRWTPTIQYLQKKIPEHAFVLIPLNLKQMYAAVSHNDLDFVFTNTGHYYAMKHFGLKPIASLVNLRLGKAYEKYGAVIFTKSGRKDINKLEDLKGKSFAAVNKLAFGGFQMAWLELLKHHIDPFKDLSKLKFVGFPQDKIVTMVLNGIVDAGTVRTDTLERMQSEGLINLDDFKILNQKDVPGFPFKLSTSLYPEWPFCAAKTTSKALSKKVEKALLSIARDSGPAGVGKYAGWINKKGNGYFFKATLDQLVNIKIDGELKSPKNKYQSVDSMMKQLKIGPYSAKKAKM